MRSTWDLPDETMLLFDGHEWLLRLLFQLNETQRLMVLMLLWRVWHVRNEITHDKPEVPAEASKRFLCSYVDNLLLIKQNPKEDMVKGKQVVNYSGRTQCRRNDGPLPTTLQWEPPANGEVKLNVDGSFIAENGSAGTGMILRDHAGHVIFAACRWLPYCAEPLEAELAACEEGLRLALHWSDAPIVLETDCAEAIALFGSENSSRSRHVHVLREFKHLIQGDRSVLLRKISRMQNGASHAMAAIGRGQQRTACWLGNFPLEVSDSIRNDCNALIN